jgi:3-hydroxybutyryl-CoA dehydrogenase
MKVLIVGTPPFTHELSKLCHPLSPTQISTSEILALDLISENYDVILEVENTDRELKQEVLNKLPEDSMILTNPLICSATEAASWVNFPERVIGFGVVPPIPTNGVIELARALQTNDETLARARDLWSKLSQKLIMVADGPGLVRARTVCCLINEAVSAVSEGIASPTDIDLAMKLGTNYPHGPLAWGDHIGLDTVLGTMNGLFAEWGDDRYRPSPLLRRMVLAGKLGKKSGEGFYRYD